MPKEQGPQEVLDLAREGPELVLNALPVVSASPRAQALALQSSHLLDLAW